jgi:HemK-like putative methylase
MAGAAQKTLREESQGSPVAVSHRKSTFWGSGDFVHTWCLNSKVLSIFQCVKKRVLMPRVRSETEAWTTYTAGLISGVFSSSRALRLEVSNLRPLRVLDICTGTGCIALHLHSLLYRLFPNLEVLGLDLSPQALTLAQSNLHHNVRKGYLHPSAERQVRFLEADLLDSSLQLPHFDIIVSNPPYISTDDFNNGQTSRSVRRYEPRMALVPPQRRAGACSRGDIDGDLFYPRILELGANQGARLLVMEVGGLDQAKRVAKIAMGKWERVEIWKDWIEPNREPGEDVLIEGRKLSIRGEGNGRVVACWSAEGLPSAE